MQRLRVLNYNIESMYHTLHKIALTKTKQNKQKKFKRRSVRVSSCKCRIRREKGRGGVGERGEEGNGLIGGEKYEKEVFKIAVRGTSNPTFSVKSICQITRANRSSSSIHK